VVAPFYRVLVLFTCLAISGSLPSRTRQMSIGSLTHLFSDFPGLCWETDAFFIPASSPCNSLPLPLPPYSPQLKFEFWRFHPSALCTKLTTVKEIRSNDVPSNPVLVCAGGSFSSPWASFLGCHAFLRFSLFEFSSFLGRGLTFCHRYVGPRPVPFSPRQVSRVPPPPPNAAFCLRFFDSSDSLKSFPFVSTLLEFQTIQFPLFP